ncbi:NUDIX hydrolase [Xiashengella succiniciproducens]|jgi:8-oxo-dGTP diphosphatase|uniref:NUDIX hydrolase n=1 Tax=Xiashengella succiniciproducens TaxID=2949635 RepID=A0A9J6ZMB2_9BACT|nr:NUDIX domain-containing protein [Alkaliflexus sp. Ai-910]URW79004.1 NUDIX hydrolase [Alkaliflexus sp. Ai-910]
MEGDSIHKYKRGVINNFVSVDCVIFGFDFNRLNVLLVDRVLIDESTGEEIVNDLTLTGNHIYENEDLDEAAARILFDLTGLEDIYLKQFKAFGSPTRISREKDKIWLKASGRNPEDRIVTVGYYSLLDIDQVTLQWKGRDVRWTPVAEVTDLGFDHVDILNEALKELRKDLIREPIGFELLPEKFTLSHLQRVYEVILGVNLDKRNFRKKVARMKYLRQLDEKQVGVAHKPARLYTFDKDTYEATRRELLDFAI